MHPLVLALVATLVMMLGVWAISLGLRNAGIVDAFWGFGFVLTASIYFATAGGYQPRRLLVFGLVAAWGLRLSIHLALRNFGMPEDYRYRALRERWGRRFGVLSLVFVFLLQAAILWALSVPLWQAMRSPGPARLTGLDLAGTALVLGGFLLEAAADEQLRRFRADPANRDRVLDRGLWRYSRHPNYFGDAVVWWGFFSLAAATPDGLFTLYAPAGMTYLLVRVSGVRLLESKLSETRPGYREYASRTSAFFLWPPRRRNEAETR